MTRKIIFLFTILLSSISLYSQILHIPQDPDSINQYNSKKQKTGFWIYDAKESLDGFSYNEIGYYENDKKQGKWIKYDGLGRLIAIENYRNDVLDGESLYFEKGALSLKANFRGLNSDNLYDTFLLIHPVSLEEYQVVVATEKGTTRHGIWKYYNPKVGSVIRMEEYQVDSLIRHFDYYISEKEDPEEIQKVMQEMPHNLPNSTINHLNKKYRKSLTK